MTKAQPVTLSFVRERETEGTWRYQEVDERGQPRKASTGAVVGVLYIRKSALNGNVPQKLSVSIQPQ